MCSALIGAVDTNGKSIFAGRAVNSFTDAEGSPRTGSVIDGPI